MGMWAKENEFSHKSTYKGSHMRKKTKENRVSTLLGCARARMAEGGGINSKKGAKKSVEV